LPIPVPYYNYAQVPLVRGLDAYLIEKKQGDGKIIPSESLDEFHMPNNLILPLVMAFGLFVASFGAMYFADGKDCAIDAVSNLDAKPWALPVLVIGLGITFVSMGVRSWKDDLGYYVPKEELERDLKEIERSEERRVGKECRSREGAEQEEKNEDGEGR